MSGWYRHCLRVETQPQNMFTRTECILICVLFLTSSALVEKIVAVLPRMKCPYRIEPHQIQGMDFIHIYPVVQVCLK